MHERCPLGGGIYWNNRNDIPETCIESCEALWREASKGMPAIDIFSKDCEHDVEFEDESLQRMEGAKRLYGILNTCIKDCGEAFSETWEYDCPKN